MKINEETQTKLNDCVRGIVCVGLWILCKWRIVIINQTADALLLVRMMESLRWTAILFVKPELRFFVTTSQLIVVLSIFPWSIILNIANLTKKLLNTGFLIINWIIASNLGRNDSLKAYIYGTSLNFCSVLQFLDVSSKTKTFFL